MTTDAALTAERDAVVAVARSIFQRGLTHGSSGNVSLRVGDLILVTPTGSSLGTVDRHELALIDIRGTAIGDSRPSKEAFLHAAMLRARPDATAVIHTHSTYSAAVSCLDVEDLEQALPPLTAYYAMRVGRLPLLPYRAPGDQSLGDIAFESAQDHHALLLSNHGPVVAGRTLSVALDALEEIEETAKLFFLLNGYATRPLDEQQVSALRNR
jgi:ribulose-5-phosphate 4-epimerase/fuculose-1-phosphate aldolase